MIRGLFRDPTLAVLKKGVEGSDLRMRAIADNLANASTPGYQRKQVTFEAALAEAVKGTLSGARARIEAVRPRTRIDPAAQPRLDGNSVDFDKEMVAAAEATSRNLAILDLLARHYSRLESAILERVR